MRNIVIIGDANPGSEIVASGNVIVMGALRGMVHAAQMKQTAIVVALKLSPTQLRIGDIITRCRIFLKKYRVVPRWQR